MSKRIIKYKPHKYDCIVPGKRALIHTPTPSGEVHVLTSDVQEYNTETLVIQTTGTTYVPKDK